MRAWRVHHHGDPAEVLTLDHALPDPSPGPGELLVDVDVAALNFADSLLCRGTYQERPDLPFVPGLELVGRVVAAGAPAPGRTPGGRGAPPPVGTRVVGLAALPAGALADRALCNAAATFALPSAIDDAHAASLLVTYQTAWVGLHRRAALRPGEVVVVHGAAGGTGSAFVQVAVAAGARVMPVPAGVPSARPPLTRRTPRQGRPGRGPRRRRRHRQPSPRRGRRGSGGDGRSGRRRRGGPRGG